MGVESDYIIADRSEAKKIIQAKGGHWKIWPTLLSKGIDEVKLTTLWMLMTGTKVFDLKFCKSFLLLHNQANNEAWVYLVPKRFITKLLAVPDKDHKKIARAWAKTEEFNDRWTKEEVWEYFVQFVAFVRQAKEAKKDLLLWMSL